MAWSASFSQDERRVTVKRPSGSHIYFKAEMGSSEASPVGSSRKLSYRVRLLNQDLTPNTQGTPAYMDMVLPSGMSLRFSAATGEVVSVTSSSGNTMSAEEYARKVQVAYNPDGSLSSVYSRAQGLMRSIPGNNSLALEWYAPGNVSASHDGEFVVTGEPYKTALYETSMENGVKVTYITNQRVGQEPHFIERREEGNKVSIIKGEGDERIVRTIERNALPGSKWERIETIRGINDSQPSRSTRTVKKYTDGGWLTISSTEGYNTSSEQTTLYTYNDQFRVSLEIKPNGGYTRYEYDGQGRVVLEATPWAGGGERGTRTTYADLRFNDFRPATEREIIIAQDGTETVLSQRSYTYEESPEVNRMTVTETALGSDQVHTSISETYGEVAQYPYARGRQKMSQGIDGVQTIYTYEATTDHGGVHKVTETVQANGSIVSAQSTRTVQYIAENGTTTRKEQYVHTGEDWSLISTEDYEYDAELKRIKTTKGNGRFSTTEWMCCGPLTETNEDGVVTSYSYNSAKQLVEVIRSATETTPETITSYTKDVAGRILSVRKDIGAMSTVENMEYDDLGRIISTTDILGRTTRTEYSNDQLTTTVTTPSGAIFVTKTYYDGSTLWQGGNGQQEIEIQLELTEEGILTTTLSKGVILSRTLENGFGETIREEQSNTLGGFIVTRNAYNSKGQLVRIQTEDMAPEITAYDQSGYEVRRIILLDELCPDDVTKNRITENTIRYQIKEDGVYRVHTTTNYNANGFPLVQTVENLLSQSDPMLESKTVSTDIYGQLSVQWTEYAAPTRRIQFNRIPTSDIVAKSFVVDGFTINQNDHAGLHSSQERFFTSSGITMRRTDARGNVVITESDVAGRTTKTMDAEGNMTSISYDVCCDEPVCITNALGGTMCYSYDIRGRKTAEYGTAIQPACFAYDDNDHRVALTTFRADEEDITTNPSNRTDGDTTTWLYDVATGLELRKTYADGSCISKTYDKFNRLETLTQARGIVTTYEYAPFTGELISVSHSDATQPWLYSYNHLGQIISVSDASCIREISYDVYGRMLQDVSLGKVESCLQEKYDSFGRSSGYYFMLGTRIVQHSILDYDHKGAIVRMNLEGLDSPFTWEYDKTSGFLKNMSYPNGVVRRNSYHPSLNLMSAIEYEDSRNGSAVARYSYQYDELMRPTQHQDYWDVETPIAVRNFTYNNRSELINGQFQAEGNCSYQYDNIGNRKISQELEKELLLYGTNHLNQYTDIAQGELKFQPVYDADGNQILTKTSTGVWKVTYDANNRPVSFISEDGRTVVVCGYDYMGRRFEKKVTFNESTISHVYYLYRGYLQVAELNMMNPMPVLEKSYLWDPTEPTATRILMMTCWKENGMAAGEHLCFTHDALKNVTSIFDEQQVQRARYEYAPFGALITAQGDMAQENRFRFSCECMDDELELVYYNYRHLNPLDGRWISRDPIAENGGENLYGFVSNSPSVYYDYQGLKNNNSGGAIAINFTHLFGMGSSPSDGYSIDLTLTAFTQDRDCRIRGELFGTVSYRKNMPSTPHQGGGDGFDFSWGAKGAVGWGGPHGSNIPERILNNYGKLPPIPHAQNEISYGYVFNFNSCIPEITSHNLVQLKFDNVVLMYQNDQSWLKKWHPTTDQAWTATFALDIELGKGTICSLLYQQFTGKANLNEKRSLTDTIYHQTPYQESLNWGLGGISIGQGGNSFGFYTDTHAGQDLIHWLIGDKKFKQTDSPRFYFEQQMMIETKKK